jgi:y4mF family transcriptional regulator
VDGGAGGYGLVKSKLLLTFLNVCYRLLSIKQAIAYMVEIVIRTPKDIGALIRSRRRSLGMSQADLAARIGTSRLWISEIERGKPRASLALVLQTLSALGLELSTDDDGKSVKRSSQEPNDTLTRELRRRSS